MAEVIDQSVYQRHGYANRVAYLKSLAENHGVSLNTVYEISSMLGPNEDFDGLVTELEDYELLFGDDEEEDEDY